jgi:predicted DNA-binding transcriptional regulator YafY
MQELTQRLKRQIEILGLAIDEPGKYTFASLADLFRVDDETVKKDLGQLRSRGIPINQIRGKGIKLAFSLETKQVQELIAQYIALSRLEGSLEKSTRLLARRGGEFAIAHLIHLQRCIDQTHLALVKYQKEKNIQTEQKELGPLAIFQAEGSWRLLALHEGIVKQFHLVKIKSVRPTKKTFKPIVLQEVDELFRYSWQSWLGKEQYSIKLLLTKEWADALTLKPVVEDQIIRKSREGKYTLEATVNSLDEVAGWVAARNGEVVAQTPRELRTKVLELCENAIRANRQG